MTEQRKWPDSWEWADKEIPATKAELDAMTAKIEDRIRRIEAARTLKSSERGPTNDEIIAEAKRISDLEWEGNEEHADFFGPLLFRLQADTSWFKPVPEVDPLVAQLVEIFRALPLYGDAGCDKLTDAEWRFVASAACEALAKRPRGWLGRPATCDEVDMSMTPLVETVARIIDPSKWAVLDSYLADMLRKYKGEHIGYDPEPFKDKASMAKAQAAIAAVFDALDI